ncbi:MAG: transporter [Gammaproteobacteria bacterium]|nr:transporter [Gammaproteobacteria bacterium]
MAGAASAQQQQEPHGQNMMKGGHGGHSMMQYMHRYPGSLVGAHMMNPGGWMLSYKLMRMEMDGNRDDTDRLSEAEVRAQGFAVVPTEMTMDMHMVGAMYGATDKFTLMAMLPYVSNDMDHVAGMPLGSVRFTTESDGIGDVKAGALIKLYDQANRSIHANALVSFPSGSIDERDLPPGQLPYPMQLGSGTYDLMPGLTYTVHAPRYSWGVQAMATIRLGDNDRDYTLGDQGRIIGWYSRDLADSLALQLRLDFDAWGNIDGADPELNTALVPTADPDRRGGQRLDVGIGLMKGVSGWQFGIDVAVPVQQNLDGPQLETDYVVGLTVKKHL